MNINQLQKSCLKSESPVVILANGRCSGMTTGLLLKAISCDTNVRFYLPTSRMVKYTMESLISLMEELKVTYVISKTFNHVRLEEGKLIEMVTPESEEECESNLWWRKRTGNTLIILDQVEMFDKYFVDYQIEMQSRNKNQLMFSTQPYHCGWRNFKMQAGYPVLDENGIPETTDTPWDYSLISWSSVGERSRCLPVHYKRHVELITGFGVPEELSRHMQNLKHDVCFKLTGQWKVGMKLTTDNGK